MKNQIKQIIGRSMEIMFRFSFYFSVFMAFEMQILLSMHTWMREPLTCCSEETVSHCVKALAKAFLNYQD